MLEKIKSDQPTILIAPSDYEHIFKGSIEKKSTMKVKAKENVKKIPSDNPTILIAPSDYEHIFKGSIKSEKRNRILKVSSDTPTALIAPSDFQHIYRDPTLAKKDDLRRTIKKDIKNISIRKVGLPKKNISRSPSNQQQQLVLPQSILDLIKRFVSKQKKEYTIRKDIDS